MPKRRSRKARMGRPPRTDNPQRVAFVLPGALRRWLHAQARAEGRPMSHVLESALLRYRQTVARRKP